MKAFVLIVAKAGILLIMVLWQLIVTHGPALASWLIDGRRYHVSAHGQNACKDCHEDIDKESLHPNPADVNKKLRDFFRIDTCTSCHDDVMEDLEEGIHGTKKIKDLKTYEYCLDCHQPHYQPLLGEKDTQKFDPNRPRYEQCGACHEPQITLPPPAEADKACVACHQFADPEDEMAYEKISPFCFHCHGLGATPAQRKSAEVVPLIYEEAYEATAHAGVACTLCHQDSDQYVHADQKLGDCLQCHLRHDEKVARDAHLNVACGACHLDGIQPTKDPESKSIVWERELNLGEPSRIHHMIRAEEESACQRCHDKGNQVGAVSMILPAKSILCMPCHAATLSIGDTTTIIALIVFLMGLIMTCSVWLTGSLPGEGVRNPFYKVFKLLGHALGSLFSLKIVFVIKALFLDVLLQRRLYRQSKTRWLIHSLIFLPFVFRFFWGLVALFASLWKPEWTWVWAMIDKNHPTTAFIFDLTGAMVLLGVCLTIIRGLLGRSDALPGLPKQDYLALGLILGIVVIGFFLEGLRIAMTGWPGGAHYAFLGYGISLLFTGSPGIPGVYGYIWYIHAIFTGAFVAYLPFSRLFHIIVAPVVLAINAVSERGHG